MTLRTPTENIAAELQMLKSAAGLVNRSHLGRVEQTGADAIDLLHRLTTNSIEQLQPGQAQDTVLASDRGRIVDVFTVVRRSNDLLLLTSDAMKERLLEQIDFYTIIEDSELKDVSSTTAQFGVAGPDAANRLSELLGPEIDGLEPLSHTVTTIIGEDVLVVHRPANAAVAYELITSSESATKVETALNEAALPTVSADAFNAYRVELGIPEAGKDFDERVNPLEAGFIDLIDFDKGCYVGQEVIARLDTYDKVQRKLVGVTSDNALNEGDSLFAGEREVGWIGSVAASPNTDGIVGIGYARNDFADPGTELTTPSGATVTVSALPSTAG